MLPFYTRVLSPTDYGVTEMLAIFTSLVGFTIALEISQGLARHFGEVRDDADRIAYASTSLWFTIASYTVFLVLGILFAGPATRLLFGRADYATIFLVALFSIWVNGLFGIVQTQLRFQLQSRHFAMSNLVNTFVSIGAIISLVLFRRMGVLGVIVGQMVGRFAGAVIALYFARDIYRLTFSREKLSEMLRFSMPLVPSSVGVFLMLYIDRIAIKELMSLADVGIFGIAYRLVSVLGLLIASVQTALVPLIYSNYRRPDTPGEIERIFRYFVAAGLIVLMGVSLYARELVSLLATPAYYGAASVVALLAAATLLSQMYMFAPGLGIANKTWTIGVISIIGAAMNTGLNIAFIPHWGIQGSALANLVSAAVVFTIHMAYSQKLYRIPHQWGKLGLSVAMVAAVIAGGYFLPPTWVCIGVKAASIVVVAVAFTRVGIVDMADVRQGIRLLSGRLGWACK
jgi:O-antigen/teichoic acid export membrane protein